MHSVADKVVLIDTIIDRRPAAIGMPRSRSTTRVREDRRPPRTAALAGGSSTINA
jgi:hypothetical protein